MEERAKVSAFRTFIRFALVWFCLFPLPLGVWEGLRFVIVALPGLFSYLFFFCCRILIVASSLYSFVLLCSRRYCTDLGTFTRREQMACVYHGRTMGEGYGYVKSI